VNSANAIVLCVWGGHSLSGGGAQCRQGDALLLVTLRHIPVLVSAAVLRSRRHHAPTHDVTRTHDVTTTHDVRRTSVVDDRSRHGLLRIVHLLIAVLVVAGLSRSCTENYNGSENVIVFAKRSYLSTRLGGSSWSSGRRSTVGSRQQQILR
jgi:hypothetical protein